MLINLGFIKAENGLFHFALDYIGELRAITSVVLVRTTGIADAVRSRFPELRVEVTSPKQAAIAVWQSGRRGEMVFTPSSHPIPWAGRQLVVVHDTFPFEGAKGAVKTALFFLAMRTSHATAGYINVADSAAFLRRRLPGARLISCPNNMTLPRSVERRDPLILHDQPVIGLFGTDSPKKNYGSLFKALSKSDSAVRPAFQLYGQANHYAAQVISEFPSLDISLVDSQLIDIDRFIASLDIVVSAATREGFSRPMAMALSMGVPCWTVDAPVLREFYDGAATFYADINALSNALASISAGSRVSRPRFTIPQRLEREFCECVAWLRQGESH